VKRLLGICLIALMPVVCVARDWDGDTLGDKIKRLFTGPSPTPAKKKTKRSTTKKSPTPRPTATAPATETPSAAPSAPANEEIPLVGPTATIPPPTATATVASSPSASASETPYPRSHSRPHAPLIEPVRAMTPRPGSRHSHVESPPPGVTIASPTPAEQRPQPMNVTAPSPSQTAGVAGQSPVSLPPSATPVVRRTPKEPVTIAPTEIVDYEHYAANARGVLDLALRLTTQNLAYKYGSADPKGGMDASGFVQYVLKQSGVKDPPRDARDQYIWVRKAGTFQAVLARSDESFELDGLKPGDLLFWASGYNVGRDPAITYTAIYLGREKATKDRLMIGASEGRTYKGQPKIGVSVLDFKVAPPKSKSSDENATPIFVGYAHVPDWPNE
jgi:peptidoglycan DL-endopeptidase CwlO